MTELQTDMSMVKEPQSSGLATASLVLGIIGVVLTMIIYLAIPLDLLAIIFGAIGLNKAKSEPIKNKGFAKAGLILGIIGIVLTILWVGVIAAILVGASSQLQNLPR